MFATLPHVIPHRMLMQTCFLGVLTLSHAVLASAPPGLSASGLTHIGRYSVMASAPTEGQVDLLGSKVAITVPNDIDTVGAALHWLLQDSGYRLAQKSVMTADVRAMLDLPFPAAHRHFDPMPLKTVLALVVGPSFQLVQDPVHRLLAFERCEASHTTTQAAAGGWQ